MSLSTACLPLTLITWDKDLIIDTPKQYFDNNDCMILSHHGNPQELKFNYVEDFYRNLGNANERYEYTRAYLYRITDFDGEVELAKDYLFFPKTKNEFLGFFHISHQEVLKALGRKRLSRKLLAELEILVANSADIILDRKNLTI